MSEASAVVVFGPGGGDGVIGRGPTRTLYAIHYARPCLVTQARLNGATGTGSRVDRMILDESPQRRAATTALMMLTELSGGKSPVPLYPRDPVSPDSDGDLAESLRIEFLPEVRAAVAAYGPITAHLMRFDHELYGPATVEALRDLGITVETFDSHEQPAPLGRELTDQ